MKKKNQNNIKLALQGGGSHGAFTWGVLDRLLEEDSINITGISGTSAGAMNATVLLSGLEKGGRQKAKENLEEFWYKMHKAGVFGSEEKFDRLFGDIPFWSDFMNKSYESTFSFWKKVGDVLSLSPYELNPLDINPLRDIVEELADFEALNNSKIPLWIAATNVHKGQLRMFTQPKLSLDAVMASACLPELYKAIEMEDGHAYWDGGYTSNPPLVPLIREEASVDVLLVQINPFVDCETPKKTHDIMSRMNQINFNNSLMKEFYTISAIKRLQNLPSLPKRDIRLHRIEAEEELGSYGGESKYNTRWSFLEELHELGYEVASTWIDDNLEKVGKENTFDVEDLIEGDVVRGLENLVGK